MALVVIAPAVALLAMPLAVAFLVTIILIEVLASALPASPVIFTAPFVVIVTLDIDKVNRPAAGIVGSAMLGPFLGMAGRHVQIQRRLLHHSRRAINGERLRIYQRWRWRCTNIHATVNTWRQSALHRGAHIRIGSLGNATPKARQRNKTHHQQGFKNCFQGFLLSFISRFIKPARRGTNDKSRLAVCMFKSLMTGSHVGPFSASSICNRRDEDLM